MNSKKKKREREKDIEGNENGTKLFLMMLLAMRGTHKNQGSS